MIYCKVLLGRNLDKKNWLVLIFKNDDMYLIKNLECYWYVIRNYRLLSYFLLVERIFVVSFDNGFKKFVDKY